MAMRPLRRHATPSLWGLGPVPAVVLVPALVLVLELEPVLMLMLMLVLPALQALVPVLVALNPLPLARVARLYLCRLTSSHFRNLSSSHFRNTAQALAVARNDTKMSHFPMIRCHKRRDLLLL